MAHAAIELYEALKEAGVSDQKAKAAAEAIEDIQDNKRFRQIESELYGLKSDVAELKSELKIVKWMSAFILAANMAIFWMLIKMAMAHGG